MIDEGKLRRERKRAARRAARRQAESARWMWRNAFPRMTETQALSILGFSLPGRPSNEEIKKQYRLLARGLHSDVGGYSDEFMALLNAAFDFLTKIRRAA